MMGRHLICYDSVDSTNTEAKRLIAAGQARHGSVILADAQTQGRGRHDRHWVAAAGGLFTSLILKSENALSMLTALPLVAGLALYQTLTPHAGQNTLRLKWPNDLLINNKKACGILVESIQDETGVFLIVGLGINLGDEIPTVSEAIVPPTSLNREGIVVSRETLFASFIETLEPLWERYEREGFLPFKPLFLEASQILGSQVTIRNATETVEGRAIDLEENGALLLQTTTGQIQTLYSGDML